ncbi:MAG: MATE family efflux transporter [Lachnospiraceae bacterium]|nr:MATE family efflux transporter [Lachnospiraceae bacterium]
MAQIKDMTKGSPAKLLLLFAIPLMLGNLFQQLYTMVDTIIVGQGVGVEALASLGSSDWLNWLFLGLVTGITQGFSILFSQFFGAGKTEQLKKSIGNAIILTAISAVVMTLVGELAITPILKLLQTPENIFGGAVQYLRVIFAGLPIILLYNLEASILRALGNSKSPLIAMIIAALTNIVLDLLFVLVFHWGIIGAAVATVIAQCVSMLYCLRVLKKIDCIIPEKEDYKLDASMCSQLFKLGMPVMFQNTVISVGGMVVQYVINGFGFLFVAGFTATNKLYGLLETAAISYGFSMTTYTAQNLGAGRYDRIRIGMKKAMLMAVATSLVISAVMLLFGKELLLLFISGNGEQTQEVLKIAYHYLSIMSYFLIVLYVLHVFRCALQGLGDTVTPMLSGIAEFVMRVAAAMLLPVLFGQEGIYYAEILAWIGANVILVPSFYRRSRKLFHL